MHDTVRRSRVLNHMQWHEALEEASRLYYGFGNVDAMFATLEPLHDMIEKVRGSKVHSWKVMNASIRARKRCGSSLSFNFMEGICTMHESVASDTACTASGMT